MIYRMSNPLSMVVQGEFEEVVRGLVAADLDNG
jgi:hypothetical protein